MPSRKTVVTRVGVADDGAVIAGAAAPKRAATGAADSKATSPRPSSTSPHPPAKKKKAATNQLGIGAFFAPRKSTPSSTARSKQPGAVVGKSKTANSPKVKPSGKATTNAGKSKKAPPKAAAAKTVKPRASTNKGSKTDASESIKAHSTKPTMATPALAAARKQSHDPDKEQIMDIVLGPMMLDGDASNAPKKRVTYERLPPLSNISPMPNHGIRNPGLRARKRDDASSSAVTPSPAAATTKKAKAGDEPVNKKLLNKLEESMDKNNSSNEGHETNEKQETAQGGKKVTESPSKGAVQEQNANDDVGCAVEDDSNQEAVAEDNTTCEPDYSKNQEAVAEESIACEVDNAADQENIIFCEPEESTTQEAIAEENLEAAAEDSQETTRSTKDDSSASEREVETETEETTDPPREKHDAADSEMELVDPKDDSVAVMSTTGDMEPTAEEVAKDAVPCPSTAKQSGNKDEGAVLKPHSVDQGGGGTTPPPKHPSQSEEIEAIAALSEESKAILKKNETTRSRYRHRADDLRQRARDGLEEEDFQLPKPNELQAEGTFDADASSPVGDFPDNAVRSLAVIIQGSRLPLSDLAKKAMEMLPECFKGVDFTIESVSPKIKVLAARESYVGNTLCHATNAASKTNVFEDASSDRMWRWELISLELLPDEWVPKVKKARSSRRKLRTHFKAIAKLLSSLDEADKLARDGSCKQKQLNNILARISTEEEKILKFEREAEKHRLLEEAKKQKEQAKLQKELQKQKEREQKELQKQKEKEQKQKEKQQKQKAKELADEEKRKEKVLRQEEKERKKNEAAQAREELKRKKEMEQEEKKIKEELENEGKLKKQKAMMMSFFSSSTKSPLRGTESASGSATGACSAAGFEAEKFRSMINSSVEQTGDTRFFQNLSTRAIASRTHRTKRVTVTVFVTVIPDNPFSQQPYDEQQEIQVPNRYKHLSFVEDHRPPYHGTWSKPRSSVVTGRSPFGKDTTYLDYDFDSEAEWEEGDEDQGEDCEDDAADDDEENMEDEEGDSRVYNFQDGWLTHDDDLGREDDEIDEETMALRKKKLQDPATDGGKRGDGAVAELSTVCVIAPAMGGLPLTQNPPKNDDNTLKDSVEGTAAAEALQLLSSHEGTVWTPEVDVCLDAFPPALVEETAPSAGDATSGTKGAGTTTAGGNKAKSSSTSQEMSQDDLKTFVEFVHHCTLPSKDKVVEELRSVHKNVTSSRAQAIRKLDSIAVKKRHPKGGSVWEVKKEILESLGLDNLLQLKLEAPPTDKEKLNGSEENISPQAGKAAVAPKSSGSRKKRKRAVPEVSKASTNLLAAFVKAPVNETNGKSVTKATNESKTPPGAKTAKAPESSNENKKRNRVAPEVPKASATLFAAFLNKRKTESK